MQLKKVVNHNNTRWRISAYVERKRVQRFFSSKKLALEWMRVVKVDESCVNFWSEISTEEQRDIISAYKLAASKGLSVYRCLLKSPAQLELKPIPVSAAILEYQAVIKQKALRPTSLKQTQRFLDYLADEFGNELVHCVSSSLLEKWFQSLKLRVRDYGRTRIFLYCSKLLISSNIPLLKANQTNCAIIIRNPMLNTISDGVSTLLKASLVFETKPINISLSITYLRV